MCAFTRLVIAIILSLAAPLGFGQAQIVQTPYQPQKVLFDFYFDHPQKINSALFWIRALMNPLSEAPYNFDPELHSIKVLIHGTEIVTVAKRNYKKYQDAVDRMRYYASLGVEFRVCGLAAADFGYAAKDLQEFIRIAPSAMTELAHWQNLGYALITPAIMEKRLAIERIR